jgi:hypothetical protein
MDFTLVLAIAAIFGGGALLADGDWSALWMIGGAVTIIPLALSITAKPTAKRIDPLKRWKADG